MTGLINLEVNAFLQVEGTPPTEVPVVKEVVFGRDPGCQVQLAADREASRRHARVFAEGETCFVEDLGSRNGTFLNGHKIEGRAALKEGDLLVIGRTRVKFQCEAASAEEHTRPAGDIIRTLDPAEPTVFHGKVRDPALESAWARLRVLYTIGEQLASVEDERQIATIVLTEIFKVLQAERGALLLLEPDAHRLRVLSALKSDGAADTQPAVSRTVLRYVFTHKKALVTADAASDPRLATSGANPTESVYYHRIRSAACVPLAVHGRILGVLQVLAQGVGQTFSEEDLRLLTGIAWQAALSLESSRLLRERQRMITALLRTQAELKTQMEHQNSLYELERQLTQTEDLESFLGAIAKQAVDLLGAEAGSIFLVEEPSGRISFAYPAGGREQFVRQLTLEKDRGIAAFVVRSGQAVVENDVKKNPHYDPSLAAEIGFETRSLVAVPMVASSGDHQKVLGAVEVINKKEGAFVENDSKMLAFLAAQVTSAILRKNLLEAKAKGDRLATIGTMASSIIHDFRNPMGIIRGYAQLLSMGAIDAAKRDRVTKVMIAEVDRCVNMTREILSYVKGEKNYNIQVIPAASFFDDIALVLENELKSSKIDFVRDIQYGGSLKIDVEKMKRVIFNFSNNAVAAMPDGGTFSIACARVGNAVEIRVADSGPGIPAELRPKLFTAFATFGKKEGTGLGLSIAKDIVESHGGTLRLDESVPKGACFVIRLKRP